MMVVSLEAYFPGAFSTIFSHLEFYKLTFERLLFNLEFPIQNVAASGKPYGTEAAAFS